MCTQSVGLLAAAVERVGIPTACIALVRSVAKTLRAPRMLAVPFGFALRCAEQVLDVLNDRLPASLVEPGVWPRRRIF